MSTAPQLDATPLLQAIGAELAVVAPHLSFEVLDAAAHAALECAFGNQEACQKVNALALHNPELAGLVQQALDFAQKHPGFWIGRYLLEHHAAPLPADHPWATTIAQTFGPSSAPPVESGTPTTTGYAGHGPGRWWNPRLGHHVAPPPYDSYYYGRGHYAAGAGPEHEHFDTPDDFFSTGALPQWVDEREAEDQQILTGWRPAAPRGGWGRGGYGRSYGRRPAPPWGGYRPRPPAPPPYVPPPQVPQAGYPQAAPPQYPQDGGGASPDGGGGMPDGGMPHDGGAPPDGSADGDATTTGADFVPPRNNAEVRHFIERHIAKLRATSQQATETIPQRRAMLKALYSIAVSPSVDSARPIVAQFLLPAAGPLGGEYAAAVARAFYTWAPELLHTVHEAMLAAQSLPVPSITSGRGAFGGYRGAWGHPGYAHPYAAHAWRGAHEARDSWHQQHYEQERRAEEERRHLAAFHGNPFYGGPMPAPRQAPVPPQFSYGGPMPQPEQGPLAPQFSYAQPQDTQQPYVPPPEVPQAGTPAEQPYQPPADVWPHPSMPTIPGEHPHHHHHHHRPAPPVLHSAAPPAPPSAHPAPPAPPPPAAQAPAPPTVAGYGHFYGQHFEQPWGEHEPWRFEHEPWQQQGWHFGEHPAPPHEWHPAPPQWIAGHAGGGAGHGGHFGHGSDFPRGLRGGPFWGEAAAWYGGWDPYAGPQWDVDQRNEGEMIETPDDGDPESLAN
jgi:hypothetical protein